MILTEYLHVEFCCCCSSRRYLTEHKNWTGHDRTWWRWEDDSNSAIPLGHYQRAGRGPVESCSPTNNYRHPAILAIRIGLPRRLTGDLLDRSTVQLHCTLIEWCRWVEVGLRLKVASKPLGYQVMDKGDWRPTSKNWETRIKQFFASYACRSCGVTLVLQEAFERSNSPPFAHYLKGFSSTTMPVSPRSSCSDKYYRRFPPWYYNRCDWNLHWLFSWLGL